MQIKNVVHSDFSSESDFLGACADFVVSKIKDALASQKKKCIIGLSGGSTPKQIFERIATDHKDDVDWSHVYIFLVDDRYVPADHKDSNQKLVNDFLLQKLGDNRVPAQNVIFPNATLPLDECIKDYSRRLHQLIVKENGGTIDLLTLGLGEDGHIASLFPTVVDEGLRESSSEDDLVVHTTTDRFAVRDRITITLPFLKSAKSHVFFMKGADKWKVWESMVQDATAHASATADLVKRWPAIELLARETTVVFFLFEQDVSK